jgi:HEAT repeat protein
MHETIRRRIGALQPLLRDELPEVRSAAAEAIERLEGVATLDEILLSLKKGDRGTRIKALYSLGAIGGERVLPPLVYCARRPEDDIRSVAVDVLGSLALPSALPVLLERLDDRVEAIQARAIAGLGNFEATHELCGRLRPFLEADDGSREAEAALALARLGDLASAERIEALLTSTHPSTRRAAATALSLLPVEARRP